MVPIGIGLLPVYSCFAGDNTGHYCVETCRPYFTQLMAVRREGESVDYRVGIWSLSQYSSEIAFLWVFQLLIFDCFWVRTQPGGGCLVLE